MRFFVDGSIKTPITEYLTNPKYQQVEYLESTGTQYIDTGIAGTSDLCVDFMVSTKTAPNQACCGFIQQIPTGYFRHHYSPTSARGASYWIQMGNSNYSSLVVTWEQDKKYHFVIDPTTGNATINDTKYTFTPLTPGIDSGLNYYIFGRDSFNEVIQKCPARFYFFKFIRNGKIIGDFIPAIRKEDGKPGIYDKVSGQFFTNAGTGEFLYGNPVYNGVPKGYKECEYLESTGTQWIDTDFTCGQTDDFTIKENVAWTSWAITTGTSSSNNAAEGQTGSTNQAFFGPYGKNTTNRFYYGLGYGDVIYTEPTYTGLNKRHVYELTRSEGKSIIKKDGVELYNVTKTGPVISKYTIFGCYDYSFATPYSLNSMKNYGTKIIKNGSLFRDLIPVLREADNEPGMYDRVSNTFFTNKGTGTFIYKLKERQTEKVTRILYSGSKMRLVRNPTA